MKKFNKNIIVFVICFLFVVCGYTAKSIKTILADTMNLFGSDECSIDKYTATIEQSLSEKIRYHNFLMDINSIKDNIQGTRIVIKDDTTVVKTNSGRLAVPYLSAPDIEQISKKLDNRVVFYKDIADRHELGFLTVAVPPKEIFESFPDNITDYSHEEYELIQTLLEEKKIPTLDFQRMISEESLSTDDLFFVTDHHWTPKTGFIVNKYICEDLHKRYGFIYNDTYTDIANYEVTTYKNQFLGSYGRKVGTYFSWSGADDFDLITPKFNTSFTEEQPYKNEIRKGTFIDTLLFMDNMKKDYYNINTYATYSGGDFRLQIMKNHMNEDGPRIVMIRDSFACVVAPFLALQASELHIIDVREGDEYVGEIVDVEQYVNQINADYVVVII